MTKTELTTFVHTLVAEIAVEQKLLLNQKEQDSLTTVIVDDMVGLGPIEPLLRDPTSPIFWSTGPKASMSSGAASWS